MLRIVKFIKDNYPSSKIHNTMNHANKNMSAFMWNWENETHSIAHGILDDITYDWFKIIQGMFKTGGVSVIVSEENLLTANKKALDSTNIKADHTGTSGFAGYLELIKLVYLDKNDKAGVFFTGAIR